MPILNTDISEVHANENVALFLTQRGNLYSTGADMRLTTRSEDFAIPRLLKTLGKVKKIALGTDHCLILDETSTIYAFGSN